MNYFVTAIGTDSGKTMVSAILLKALQADYWKPIQAGRPTDTETLRSMLGETHHYFEEAYLLEYPMSPHAAAERMGIDIDISTLRPPVTNKDLVIEGAGGLMVPLNDEVRIVDMVKVLDVEVVLVSNLYLGSINHTLLTIDKLKSSGCKVKGIIFNGEENKDSEEYILNYSSYPCLLRVRQEEKVDDKIIEKYASALLENWYE